MPTITRYAAGTPCWVDIMAKDAEAARAFYGDLFGWTFEVGGPEAGNYAICLLNGDAVAGLGPSPAPDVPVAWTTYIASDDVDATVAAIKEAGGSVLMGPMDVMTAGRMAVVADPTGAVFGVWQARDHLGAAIANEPGSFIWNECVSSDIARARDFYVKVFGYAIDEMQMGGATPYNILKVGDKPVGGAMAMPAEMPEGIPSHWMTYFSVADTDASLEKAKDLGATLLHGPQDAPYGRFAVVMDPQGAAFTILKPPPAQP